MIAKDGMTQRGTAASNGCRVFLAVVTLQATGAPSRVLAVRAKRSWRMGPWRKLRRDRRLFCVRDLPRFMCRGASAFRGGLFSEGAIGVGTVFLLIAAPFLSRTAPDTGEPFLLPNHAQPLYQVARERRPIRERPLFWGIVHAIGRVLPFDWLRPTHLRGEYAA